MNCQTVQVHIAYTLKKTGGHTNSENINLGEHQWSKLKIFKNRGEARAPMPYTSSAHASRIRVRLYCTIR